MMEELSRKDRSLGSACKQVYSRGSWEIIKRLMHNKF